MAVKIKLKRMGKIRNPQYRIIVADSRTKRDGRAIEEIGLYHPKEDPSLIRVDSERAQYWLSVGAQPTDPVRALLKVTGDWQKFTGTAGAEGTLRTKQAGVDKSAVFAQVLADAHKGDEAAQAAEAKPAKAARPAKKPKAAEATAEDPAEATPQAPADVPAEAAAEVPAEAGEVASDPADAEAGETAAAASDDDAQA